MLTAPADRSKTHFYRVGFNSMSTSPEAEGILTFMVHFPSSDDEHYKQLNLKEGMELKPTCFPSSQLKLKGH